MNLYMQKKKSNFCLFASIGAEQKNVNYLSKLCLPAANHEFHTFLQEPWILSIMMIVNGLLLHISIGENAFMLAS